MAQKRKCYTPQRHHRPRDEAAIAEKGGFGGRRKDGQEGRLLLVKNALWNRHFLPVCPDPVFRALYLSLVLKLII